MCDFTETMKQDRWLTCMNSQTHCSPLCLPHNYYFLIYGGLGNQGLIWGREYVQWRRSALILEGLRVICAGTKGAHMFEFIDDYMNQLKVCNLSIFWHT